ncbi:hypothetical protein K1719_021478 [Acacia pycnantha]|nr:hypothetical protein K1719_021478 [Acacia pycnantha]
MRSRFWGRYQILGVLRNLKGTNRIHGIVLDLEKGDAKGQKIADAIFGKNLRCGSSLANVVSFFKQMHKKYFQRVERDIEAGVIHAKAFISMVNLMLLQINDLTLEAILRVCGIGKAVSYNKLVGSISDKLGNLYMYDFLLLNNSDLSGEIPNTFENLSSLMGCNFSYNNLSGPIPSIPLFGNMATRSLDIEVNVVP